MNLSKTQITIADIFNHLQEESFSKIISWKGQVCTILNLEIFTSVALSTLFSSCTLELFLEILDNNRIKYFQSVNDLTIIFPDDKEKQVKRSRSGNPIFKKFDEIEAKQARLFASILRAQEKLERAIRINNQIKLELKKSDQYQKFLLGGKTLELGKTIDFLN